MTSAIVAALHYLALAIGLPAVFLRGRALRAGELDARGLRRVFAADSLWGLAALIWLVTGAWRAFGGLEKGTEYYLQSPLFHAKFGLFGVVFLLELIPMVTLIRWRMALRRGATPDTRSRRVLSALNHVELALVVVIVFVAAFMARGFGRS